MAQPLTIIIVEKTGALKSLSIKDFKEDEIYKKCGFKKSEDFVEQTEWKVKLPSESNKYYIKVFAKTDGRANYENKYDFPPPIDNKLFFGNCAIVAFFKKDGVNTFTDLSLQLWEKIYEKLFGGFEDLVALAVEDEEEEDELANVPKEKKTKQGYLKDGFVVDSSDDTDADDDDEDSFETIKESETQYNDNDEAEIEDIGSELSEEAYDYSDDDEIKK
jgi:hypothetical protein